mmetsp:Transcript_5306/g.8352  ORF Transcript_5306/g.8352 Transcript_5306/m.8352 type:complete len:304 (-) Transcript_5306:370-1281(-)
MKCHQLGMTQDDRQGLSLQEVQTFFLNPLGLMTLTNIQHDTNVMNCQTFTALGGTDLFESIQLVFCGDTEERCGLGFQYWFFQLSRVDKFQYGTNHASGTRNGKNGIFLIITLLIRIRRRRSIGQVLQEFFPNGTGGTQDVAMSGYKVPIIGLNRNITVQRRTTQISVRIGHQRGNGNGRSRCARFLNARFDQTIHDLVHHIDPFFRMHNVLLSLRLSDFFEGQTETKRIEGSTRTGNVEIAHVAEQHVMTDGTRVGTVLEQHIQNREGRITLFGSNAVHAAIVIGIDNGNVEGSTIVGIQFT